MLDQISLALTEEEINAVIALFKEIDGKLALPTNVPIAGRKRQNMGQASTGYVEDCIEAAIAFPTVPSGETDVKKMEEKLATAKVISKVLNVGLPVILKLINIRRLLGQDLMVESNSIKENFERVSTNRADTRTTTENLRKRYARAKKEDDDANKKDEDPKL